MKRKLFLFLSAAISIIIISIVIYKSINTVYVVKIPTDTLNKIFSENIKSELNRREDLRLVFIDEISYTHQIIVCEEKGNKAYIYSWLDCYGHSSETTITRVKIPAVVTLDKNNNDYSFSKLAISTAEEGLEAVKIFPYRIRNNYKVFEL